MRIKQVAVALLATLKAEKLRVAHRRDRESTRDAVQTAILNFLYSDETGLPVDSYDEEEAALKTSAVFQHVFRVYATVPSPYYARAA